jgi:hydrocephalus-inducing protein
VINPTISTPTDAIAGYFFGKSNLIIPAKQSGAYEINYAPKTMTKKNAQDVMETHSGSLFFPLPNGTALLYNLNGTATEPEAEALGPETVQAKKARFIIIPVRNWLKIDQRFKVSWTVEGDKDQTTFVKGANMLDVSGDSVKDFKLNFLAYKVGSYKVKLTFLNETSGEFLPFILSVNAGEGDLLETIELASPIRESVSRIVTIENPTDTEVVIARNQFTCASEYIEVGPETLKIPAKSERGFEISYRPLIISEQEVDLILKNPVLGDFKYKLILKGQPPSSQRSLAFRCALGNDLVQAFKFTHFLKKPTAYAIKVERLDQPGQICDFKSEVPQVQAAAADSAKGVEILVNVKYEPFTIGETRAIIKLTSPEGMEYSCLLLGKATAPLPQGPVKCPPGAKPAGIDFKNPLNEKCEFIVTFDNPNFSLASKLPGPIDPGKVTNLQIKYDAKPDLPTTGRMIVQTKGLPPWIYYLQGE